MRLKKLPELCKANDMPAIAVTETNNLFSALEFSVLFKDHGLQPILGCQIDIKFYSILIKFSKFILFEYSTSHSPVTLETDPPISLISCQN